MIGFFVEGSLINYSRIAVVLSALLLCGCSTVDRTAAANLATSGQTATAALSTQAAQATAALQSLNQWWRIRDTFLCSNRVAADERKNCITAASEEPADPSVDQIVTVLQKHKLAVDSLNQAYGAMLDLAQYNAGKEATAALSTSFASINTFLAAVSALPNGSAITAISSTAEKGVGIGISLLADREEDQQILRANRDLQVANDALYAALNVEKDVVSNLLGALQKEREQLYQAGLRIGLIAPIDVVGPIYSQVFPGIQLRTIPSNNADVVEGAAVGVLAIQDQAAEAAVGKTYESALTTLHSISQQHQQFAAGQTLSLGQLESDVASLQANVSQLSVQTSSKGKN